VINSLVLEEMIKFLLRRDQRSREKDKERKLANISGVMTPKVPYSSLTKSRTSINSKKVHKLTRNENIKKEKFKNIFKIILEKKPQIFKILEKLEIENQTNENQGSKNLYLFLYFKDAPYLIKKMKTPNSGESEKSLNKFLGHLWNENNKKMMENQTSKYFEGISSKINLRSFNFSSNRFIRNLDAGNQEKALNKMYNSRSNLHIIRENESVSEDLMSHSDSFNDTNINSFFLNKFSSERQVEQIHRLPQTNVSDQLEDFLREEERLFRIKDVIYYQHLIFNNPKFHRKKYLNITEIGIL
jgi:hypothetical protein